MVKEIFSLKSKDEVATPLHCVEWKADGDAKPDRKSTRLNSSH